MSTNTTGMLIDHTPGITSYEERQGCWKITSASDMAYGFGKLAYNGQQHQGAAHDAALIRWLSEDYQQVYGSEPNYPLIYTRWCQGWNDVKNASPQATTLADQF